jgi:hypothetical protein
MSALTFDPWGQSELQSGKAPPAKPANPANPGSSADGRLAGLAPLAAAPDPNSDLELSPQAVATVRAARKWSYSADDPVQGDWCACCRGGRFWREMGNAKGWRCSTCHPPDHLPPSAVIGVRT